MADISTSNKRIAKNTIILYIRMLCTMVIGLYTSRVILNTLGVTDFGVYNVVGGIITMFGFINGTMAGASSRFITFELGTGNKMRLKKVFGQSLSIHLLIALLILILGETIGLWFVYEKVQIPTERFSSALIVYHLSIAASMLNIMSVPYNSAIIAHEKMSAFAYITILDVVLKLAVAFLLILIPFDKLIIYAILIFIVQIIDQAIYLIYSCKNFEEARTSFLWDKPLFKEMSSFAGWNLFGNIAYTLFTQGQNILLNLFFGPIVNAARGVSVQVQSVVGSFIRNFQTALNPQIIKNYASGQLPEMNRLIYMSTRLSFFLMLMLSLPVLIKTEYIMTLWLKIVPEHTIIFLRLMLIISITDTLSNPLMVAAQSTGKIKVYQQVIGGILLCIIPISYIVLKCGAPAYSVFIVHLICTLIAQGARLYMIRPMIKLPLKEYLKQVLIKISIVLIPAGALSIIFNNLFQENSISNLILSALSSIITTSVLIYFWGLSKEEQQFISNKIAFFKVKNNK